MLLSSNVATNNFLFTADAANLDVFRQGSVAIHRGVLHLARSRFLWRDSCFEQLHLVNHGLDQLEIPVSVRFDADYADIFEIRGTGRDKRGRRLDSQVYENTVVLSYEGLDRVVRETLLQTNVAPDRSSEAGMDFFLALRPKQSVTLELEIGCNLERPHQFKGYSDALSASRPATEEAFFVGATIIMFRPRRRRAAPATLSIVVFPVPAAPLTQTIAPVPAIAAAPSICSGLSSRFGATSRPTAETCSVARASPDPAISSTRCATLAFSAAVDVAIRCLM